MIHPLILQLRFARSEFKRGLDGLSEVDARRRIEPMNCISWNVGHLAWQEQRYWLQRLQNKMLATRLDELFCYGCPPATPPLSEMLAAWQNIIAATDPFLDTLTTEALKQPRAFRVGDESFTTNTGNLLQRVIYHYWYHNGENQAIRQILRHSGLQDFVGNLDEEASYQPH